MLDFPLYCDSSVTLDVVRSAFKSTLALDTESDQQYCSFYRNKGGDLFVLHDLSRFIPKEAIDDIDWQYFIEGAPVQHLERLTCSRLNIEHRNFKAIEPLVSVVITLAVEIWALLPGGVYRSGKELQQMIAEGRPLDEFASYRQNK